MLTWCREGEQSLLFPFTWFTKRLRKILESCRISFPYHTFSLSFVKEKKCRHRAVASHSHHTPNFPLEWISIFYTNFVSSLRQEILSYLRPLPSLPPPPLLPIFRLPRFLFFLLPALVKLIVRRPLCQSYISIYVLPSVLPLPPPFLRLPHRPATYPRFPVTCPHSHPYIPLPSPLFLVNVAKRSFLFQFFLPLLHLYSPLRDLQASYSLLHFSFFPFLSPERAVSSWETERLSERY